MSTLIGQQIARYRIEALLGQGGMGAVYRAFDLNLSRLVSLKVMHEHLGQQPEFRQRFWKEAQVAARLDHPAIVRVYDFGSAQNLLYLVMAFIPGGSLRRALHQAYEQGMVVDLGEALILMAQVADALDYAHRQGVIHRDIKPDNVLLQALERPDREGEVALRAVVTDLGLAKLVEGDFSTQSGTMMGTLAYMSPEQVLGEAVDGRSDLYSVGVMLYELATGQLPFQIKSPTEAVVKHLRERPVSPEQLRPELPASLSAIILKAIARYPAERYQNGADLATDLRQAARELGKISVSPVTTAPTFSLVQSVGRLSVEMPASELAATVLPADLSIQPVVGETVHILSADLPARTMPLTKSALTVGRAEDNDLILTGNGISRYHLRLNRTAVGWQVVELGSTNGTVLDGVALVTNVPTRWDAGISLQIGSCTLIWTTQPAIDLPPSPPIPPTPASLPSQPPTVPRWLLLLLGVIFVAICLAVIGLFSFFNQQDRAATATASAIAEQTSLAVTQAAINAQATTASKVALTETAAANQLLGDDDGDGLSNVEEQNIGTNAQNPDSDADGLSDGAEFKQYRTDPLNSDTDGDGIGDGAEVSAGTNPNLAETATPTATPTPTSLPTPTPTPTPRPAIIPAPSATAVVQPIAEWAHPLRLVSGQGRYSLQLVDAGTLNLVLNWPSIPQTLNVQLLHPDGSVMAEETSPSPLILSYTVSPAEFELGETWDLVISNAGTDPANITLTLTYPSGAPVPFIETFTLSNNQAWHTSIALLQEVGNLIAEASWSGIFPNNPSLSIYAPTQLEPYETISGSSPLTLRYRVKNNELDAGTLWRISLQMNGNANATGTIQILYP